MINHRVIWRRSLLAGAVLGALVGGLMMYVAWQHNAQGEIHDGVTVYWLYWFGIGLSWLMPVGLVSGLVTWIVWSISEWVHPKDGANSTLQRTRARGPRR